MLSYLHIENIAVIEKSSMELENGFTLLTGETGAGKSIVIDSINAVLGERTSRELIRTGCEKATVSAVFTNLSPALLAHLEELGYEPDEDGSLLIQRTLYADGKGNCRLGGRPVTAAVLKEIGRQLINIHGQHDNQALLNPDRHYAFLDALADNGREFSEYRRLFEQYRKSAKELSSLQMDESQKAQRMDLLNFQINELERAGLSPGEWDRLIEQKNLYQNSEKLAADFGAVYAYLNGQDEAEGAASLVQTAGQYLSEAARLLPSVVSTAERLTEIGYELEELAGDVRNQSELIEYNPLELEKIEQRLDMLYRLSRKYGQTEEEMLEFLEKAKAELDTIIFSQQRVEELTGELDHLRLQLKAAADRLSGTRQAAGRRFSEEVCLVLAFLDMPSVKLVPEITPTACTSTGADRVEFLISTNPGEPSKPLSKIASGGELSRIMLAIKSVLADKDDVDTLIFDEIDTGISGKAAGKVGIQLKKVSRSRQVLCVTHLAQIAALADHHLLIEKQTRAGKTYTSVRPLSIPERVEEVARIMSGGTITENLRKTAEEMMKAGETV